MHVNTVLHGAWFLDEDDLKADKVIFDLKHLTTWVDQSGIETKHPFFEGDPAGPHTVITSRRVPALTAVARQSEVTLGYTTKMSDDPSAASVTESWQLLISRTDLTDLGEFTDVASDFQALLSIASGATADFEKVVIQHPELVKRNLAGEALRWRDDITYYARWSHRSPMKAAPVGRYDLYFTLADLGGIDGVAKWLDTTASYRTELGRVMATRYNHASFLEDRIMNVCAAVESFDRVRRPGAVPNKGKRITHAERLSECVAFAGEPFNQLVPDATAWVKATTKARNNLAHHGDVFRQEGGVGQHLLSEQAFWLFAICMLREAGAPDAVFDSIRQSREFQWLIDQASDEDDQ